MHYRRRVRAAQGSAILALAAWSWVAIGQEPAAVPPSGSASAPNAATPTELRLELLRDRWAPTTENREQAPRLYDALRKNAVYVPADDYLYGLVRFKHNQYDEAEAAIDRAIERSPHDPMFLKSRIWIALARKRYEDAETALAGFQAVLFREKPGESARPASARSEDLAFLGQVHGYLATAAERLSEPEPFEKLRDAVAENLSVEELRTVEAAERETQERNAALIAERDEAVAALAEAADEAAQEMIAEFDERRRQLQERRVEIETQRTEAVEKAKTELAALAQTQAQARQATAALTAQLQPARAQYSQATESVERLRNSLILVPFNDFGGQQIVANQLQAAQQRASALESQLLLAEQAFAQASSALVNVNREIAVQETTHRQKVGDIERTLRQVDDDLKKLDKEEEKALGKSGGTTVAIRQMSQKIGALDSYVDYSLEIPRLKLIEFLERR